MNTNLRYLVSKYVDAKDIVINEGFDYEIDWQQDADFWSCSEQEFLREAAWVILSSGMRETVIRSKFEDISSAFLYFENASEIIRNISNCRNNALSIFNHSRKIDAIISLAFRVSIDGYDSIQKIIDYYGVDYLQSFDFLGPATSYHLAKNIGMPVPKPDRHLCRVAKATGYDSVGELCESISEITGDPVSVVDLVIWRFATIRNDYLVWFSQTKQ